MSLDLLPRHDDVGDDEVERPLEPAHHLEGLGAVAGGGHLVAGAGEGAERDGAHRRVVLHEQEPLVALVSEAGAGRGSTGVAGPVLRGRQTTKRVPSPGSLSTWMWPPAWATIPWTVARPSPVPFPCSLVVKKGSKRCSRTSADHAAAVVLHGEPDPAARRAGPGWPAGASSSVTVTWLVSMRSRAAGRSWRRGR